jgi:hypothetical protein
MLLHEVARIDDYCRVSLFHKKLDDSMLTKRHVGDSHFLAVHDGNVRGVHVPILRSYAHFFRYTVRLIFACFYSRSPIVITFDFVVNILIL